MASGIWYIVCGSIAVWNALLAAYLIFSAFNCPNRRFRTIKGQFTSWHFCSIYQVPSTKHVWPWCGMTCSYNCLSFRCFVVFGAKYSVECWYDSGRSLSENKLTWAKTEQFISLGTIASGEGISKWRALRGRWTGGSFISDSKIKMCRTRISLKARTTTKTHRALT